MKPRGIDEPTLPDKIEGALAVAALDANVQISEPQWNTFCGVFAKEFARRTAPPRTARAPTADD